MAELQFLRQLVERNLSPKGSRKITGRISPDRGSRHFFPYFLYIFHRAIGNYYLQLLRRRSQQSDFTFSQLITSNETPDNCGMLDAVAVIALAAVCIYFSPHSIGGPSSQTCVRRRLFI